MWEGGWAPKDFPWWIWFNSFFLLVFEHLHGALVSERNGPLETQLHRDSQDENFMDQTGAAGRCFFFSGRKRGVFYCFFRDRRCRLSWQFCDWWWPFWGPVSLELVTSNDQKSKGSLFLNHLDNMAPVDMAVVSHYLQGFIHVRWLALGFLFTIDLVLHDWTPKTPPWPVSLQARWSSDPIRIPVEGDVYWEWTLDGRVFFTRFFFLNVVGHFDEVLCLFVFLKIDIRIYLFMKIF